jgi:carbon storage regulator
MLVLSRKKGEQVVIGPNIVLTVLDVRGETVKLGFVAPGEIPIHREEVQRRIHRREAAADTSAGASRPAESPFFVECA